MMFQDCSWKKFGKLTKKKKESIFISNELLNDFQVECMFGSCLTLEALANHISLSKIL